MATTWTAGVYKAGDMISYKGTIYVCISDTTAADSAPDLSNKWQSTGKVQGITVNGNEVPISNGIAAITLADLSVGYTTILAGANEWGDYELNGTKYNAIRLAQGSPEVGVFVDNNGVESEIVCQRVVASNVLYLCVNKQDTSKANNGQPAKVVVRVVGGSSVGGGGSVTLYNHHITLKDSASDFISTVVNIVTADNTPITTTDKLYLIKPDLPCKQIITNSGTLATTFYPAFIEDSGENGVSVTYVALSDNGSALENLTKSYIGLGMTIADIVGVL